MDQELSEIERQILLHFNKLKEEQWLFVKLLIEQGKLKKIKLKDSSDFEPFRD